MKSYIFNQKENDPQQWYWFQEGLTKQEVDKVIMLASELPIERATTLNSEGVDVEQNDPDGVRSSMVKWIPPTYEWDWLYKKMIEMAEEANDELWNFDLVSADESIQYTEYYANEKGHYDWHQDVGPGEHASKRKISITLQLSEDDEYEGGELQISGGGDGNGILAASQTCPRGKGVGVLFPSYMMHRVSEVTKGTRRSLVLWVGGAHYR